MSCHSLEQNGEAEENAAEEDGGADGSVGDKGRVCCTSRPTSGRGTSLTTKANNVTGSCGRCGRRGGGRRRARGGVTQVGRLSTTGVVGTAAVGAGVVTVAVVHTLVAPLLADEEGESLRVLGDVGRDAVFANARVGQGVLRAC